ncbi:hypothetical protein [Kitasatospora sp. NPDC005856]|uniref:hypothetical protein n=1 Tax=Kitasatospora sp. NPDC005856 TaxID=3154566 RepID=UPI0033FF4C3F
MEPSPLPTGAWARLLPELAHVLSLAELPNPMMLVAAAGEAPAKTAPTDTTTKHATAA